MKWISNTNILNDKQYNDDSNLQKRIQIHKYSINKQSWSEFLSAQIKLNDNDIVLDIGCGNAAMWKELLKNQPNMCKLVLSDVSSGMLAKAKETIDAEEHAFEIEYRQLDAVSIPYPDNSFNVVIANHMLYHVSDIEKALSEISRVLKMNGKFYASTVGKNHMIELSTLVKALLPSMQYESSSIAERFGLENGAIIVGKQLGEAKCITYDDYLLVPDAAPIVEYISSMDNDGILNDNEAFNEFMKNILTKYDFSRGFRITKSTGIIKGIKNK